MKNIYKIGIVALSLICHTGISYTSDLNEKEIESYKEKTLTLLNNYRKSEENVRRLENELETLRQQGTTEKKQANTTETTEFSEDFTAIKEICKNVEELKTSTIGKGIELFINLKKLTITGSTLKAADVSFIPNSIQYLYIPNANLEKTHIDNLFKRKKTYKELMIITKVDNYKSYETKCDRLTVNKNAIKGNIITIEL